MDITLKAGTPTEQRILDYLKENASDTLAYKINAGKKTLSGAMGYAQGEAQKLAKGGGCVCVQDEIVFGWIIHFFEEDGIKEGKKAKQVMTATCAKKAKEPVNKPVAASGPQMTMFETLFSGGLT